MAENLTSRNAPKRQRLVHGAANSQSSRERGASQDYSVAAGHGALIGIVDDDASVSHSLEVLLAAYGFDVVAFSSGTEFLADPAPFSCLIIDQHLHGMNGLEVVTALHTEQVRVPIILITSRMEAEFTRHASSLGVFAVLEKTFPPGRLAALLRTTLNVDG